MFDKHEIEIKCPKCGNKTKKTIAWLKTHDNFSCRCGTVIKFDKSKFTGPLRELDKSFDKLKDTFRRFRLK